MSATLRNAPRRSAEPAVVRPGRTSSVRSKVRLQWLVLGAALVVLAGSLVAWGLARAADRVQVVTVARPVQAGDVIDAADLAIGEIAVDPTITGLVPAASLERLAGRVATIDLEPGMLVTAGMWAQDAEVTPGERTVGAVLAPGRHPTGLAHGSLALAIDVRASAVAGTSSETLDDPTATSDGSSEGDVATPAQPPAITTFGTTLVRVLEVELDESGDLRVTLAVPEADAERIAVLAATDALAVIGVPAQPVATEDASGADPASTSTVQP